MHKSMKTVRDIASGAINLFKAGAEPGLSTGYLKTDDIYTVRPKDMTVVTGVTSCGKSEWLDNIVFNMTKIHDWKFAFCSFENDVEEHLLKFAEKFIGKPYFEADGQMTGSELSKALDWLDNRLFFIDPEDALPIETILERFEEFNQEYDIQGCIIDPYNYITVSEKREDRHISDLMSKIRMSNKKTDCHTWIVAHARTLPRDKEGNFPVVSLNDISGGVNWGNKADCGLVVHRVENCSELHVKKIRRKQVGRLGAVAYNYDRFTGRFIEV